MARRKKSNFGCLFWLALALLVVVVFHYNRESINRALVDSGLLDMVRREGDEPTPSAPAAPLAPQPPSEPAPATPAPVPVPTPEAEPDTAPEQPEGPASSDTEVVIRLRPAGETERDTPEPTPEEKANIRRARLFFVSVDDQGEIQLQGVIRAVPYDDSPLRETLTTLLAGQVPSEINGGLLTMIPSDVELRNVYVRGSTAYVDFSDEFRFNSLGQVGLSAQVGQIVYTATEFRNVRDVQILIEGKQIEYLSSEGPFIGGPLSRERLMEGSI
jgi:hypothetical protein